MDEVIAVDVGPAGRTRHAGVTGPAPQPRRRVSAGRKQEALLRLLRGEDLELLSRELGMTTAKLGVWRDQFLATGDVSLESRPADTRDVEIGRLQAEIGELTMMTKLWEASSS